MISGENNITRILKDIKNAMKEPPQVLFARLVNDRLNKAVEMYYKDLMTGLSMVGVYESRLDKDLRRLIK
jgi:hypothetical protein